ncbi:xanthine dehydrogenase [Salinisphaera orenii MK-B5]|uniref:Xanthine dehydrogenase n=1 Tax=Salinisphaera orenii MK-B5 TaxID=856730 RepID=A0A423PKZ1_9GAMM|nr:XdhC family protein [Salinisphaera orenii]ROO26267.1 xanthine dehydrogenase [Salinisphaera orenii MK-B5]
MIETAAHTIAATADRDDDPAAAAADWPAWPTYGLVEDLLPVLMRWRNAGRRAALATLVTIEGSSPRPLGSEMAVSDHGEVAGYVSGGCVEGAVAAHAAGVLAGGPPVMLDYGAGSPVLDVQLTCGGRIGIFVRALSDLDTYVDTLHAARRARRAIEVTVDLDDGRHLFDTALPPGRHGFRRQHLPPPRLVVAGGDPVTLALCQLAPTFGFETILLRPYGPSCAPPGTTLTHYDTRPLARALSELHLDAHTAVYTLTHDLDDDDRVLAHALASPAFAIGALGSRRKTRERAARLRDAGFDAAAIDRLNSPAGLDIDARQPREIALSVLAELTTHRPHADAGTC